MKFTSMVGSDESDMTALGNDSRHNHLRSVSAVVKGKYYFAPLRTSSIAEIFGAELRHYRGFLRDSSATQHGLDDSLALLLIFHEVL